MLINGGSLILRHRGGRETLPIMGNDGGMVSYTLFEPHAE